MSGAWRTWVRYAAVQVGGYLIDMLVFVVLFRVFGAPVLVANLPAKALAATATFFGQKYLTFERASTGRAWREALTYFALVALNAVLASGLLLVFHHVFLTEIAKLLADGLIFAFSYFVLKNVIFRPQQPAERP